LKFLPQANFLSAIPVCIFFETRPYLIVLSFFRSKVRDAGIEIYHIKSSEKFQGRRKWLQRRNSFSSWFCSEKCQWLEDEAAKSVGVENLTQNTGFIIMIFPGYEIYK